MNKAAHTCCADQTKSLLMLSLCCTEYRPNNVVPLNCKPNLAGLLSPSSCQKGKRVQC